MLDEVKEFIQSKRAEYLGDWGDGNASKFEADEHYKWMADFLNGFERILEIGTGDGRATLELVKRGHKVISLDENSVCLDAAQQRLESNGFSVCRLQRETIELAPQQKYSISYSKINHDLSSQIDVYLIESDVLNDPEVVKWLQTITKFDAVICWLMGTNAARAHNEAINISQMPTPFHYRIFVQNEVYEIADKILRSNGILHIVDRGKELAGKNEKDDLIESHRDQASVTNLVVQSAVESREYEDPNNGYDVGMVTNVDDKIVQAAFDKKYLHSIISLQP
ncbi:methyltransferase family protein [Onishia taeanensis]|uniref:Methyltransferase family protein n=1 Tax=Onishia taeanensis TaxID=284577 RepID=A0A328XRN8_9GAMM|nr:class I SAM-dependent methyltransferase [Halomonas taeanensis]RAR61565.1 methyltransferase family protein [Halomonas taeanensis]